MSPWGVYACGEWGSVWDLQVLKYHIGRGQEELNHAHGGEMSNENGPKYFNHQNQRFLQNRSENGAITQKIGEKTVSFCYFAFFQHT